ncbi:MAG: S1 RNA-binding domain-containing protein [Anaerolineae bacterium]
MDSEERVAGQEPDAQPEKVTGEHVDAAAEPAPKVVTEATESETKAESDESSALEALKPGTKLEGKVRNVVDFGAFVDIGVGRDGLAHISTLKRAGIDQTIKVGDTIEVIVRRVNLDDNRISLTIPGPEKAAKTRLQDLNVNEVVTGHIVRLADFGAFVDIGAQIDGLLHISQLPGGYIRHPSEAVQVGDEVQVRILEVDPRKRRISLSMKEESAATETYSAPEPQQQQASPEARVPTAFEVAFQKARSQRKRQSRESGE